MANTYRITGSQGARSRITIGRPASNISRRSGKIPGFILDLDQTIWDTSSQAKEIEDELMKLKAQKGFLTIQDWSSWRNAAAEVTEIPEMVQFARGLQESGIKPVIMTARDALNKDMIMSTLKEYGISTDNVMMRGLSQSQQNFSSDMLKASMMQKMSSQFNFLTMLDDSAANLKAAYKFGVPLSIQPERSGFDSLEASLIRGAQLSEVVGPKGMAKAQRAAEPIIRAGGVGVMSPGTLKNLITSTETALKVARGIL